MKTGKAQADEAKNFDLTATATGSTSGPGKVKAGEKSSWLR